LQSNVEVRFLKITTYTKSTYNRTFFLTGITKNTPTVQLLKMPALGKNNINPRQCKMFVH
jgi:hypothetical protein